MTPVAVASADTWMQPAAPPVADAAAPPDEIASVEPVTSAIDEHHAGLEPAENEPAQQTTAVLERWLEAIHAVRAERGA